MFEAKVVLDSVSPAGKRLTTMTWKYPRFIHSEIMTHRMLSKNSASSRAIPFKMLLKQVMENPVVPIRFGSEQKGMQTGGEIDDPQMAEIIWLQARDHAVAKATRLADLGVHKSLCNRLLEPWMWITVVISGTENLWRLRIHPDAEVHFQRVATMAKEAMDQSVPDQLDVGEWHMPFIDSYETMDGHGLEVLKRASVARCARVSYLTHEGERSITKDLILFDRLCQGSGFGHWSPHEHVAQAAKDDSPSGNFRGWHQFRKEFSNECA
jgi:hypothetical protein